MHTGLTTTTRRPYPPGDHVDLELDLDPDMDDAAYDAALDALAGPIDNDLLAA